MILSLKKHKHFWIGWDIVSSFFLGAVLWIIPTLVVFPHTMAYGEIILDALIFLFFSADHVMTYPQLKPYERVLSIASLLPLALVVHAFVGRSIFVPALLMNHLLRLPLFIKRFRNHTKVLQFAKWHQIGTILAGGLIVVHWVANIFIFIEFKDRSDVVTTYIKGVYWCLTTLTTIGYGDITPQTNIGRVFTMGIQVLGVGIFGLIISNMSRFLISTDKRLENNREKMDHLENFMRHYDVPRTVRNRVFSFYQHLISQATNEDEKKILSELPPALQKELEIFMYLKPISKLPLFHGLPQSSLVEISLQLDKVFYSPEDQIINRGDVGHEMYIIAHGEVKVTGDQDRELAVLHHGQCFGEMSLIQQEVRSANVRAKTYCDLFILQKDKFVALTSKFPILRTNIEQIAAERSKKSAS